MNKKITFLIALLLITALILTTLAQGSCSNMPDSQYTSANAKTLQSNQTIAGQISPPNFGSSTIIHQSKPTLPKDEAQPVRLEKEPLSTPIATRQADGSYSYDLLDSQNHWWEIDYWANGGGQLPTWIVEGQFTAVDNTIDGLESGDVIMYLPLNVMFGTSASNGIWFQFQVYLTDSSADMWIWDNRVYDPWGYADYHSTHIEDVTYTPGHTYYFSITTNFVDTIRFWIEDYDNSDHWEKTNWNWDIVSYDIVYSEVAFSPASAIEGYTTNSELTNVPFFRTDTGLDLYNHWHGYSGSGRPTGISTETWGSPGSYIWAMNGHNNIGSVNRYGNYGYGNCVNPNNIIGPLPNYNWADYWGGNPGDGGYLIGNMNTMSGGDIYIWAKTSPSYISTLYVYVSDDDYNWYQIAGPLYISSTYNVPYSLGSVDWGFRYIAVVGFDSGYSVNMHVDCAYAL